MTNPLTTPAEHGDCRHCHKPIIRWAGEPVFNRWIHNPANGFRRYRCDGASTVAEPE